MKNHNLLNRQFKTMCCNRRFPIFYLPEGKQLEESFLLYFLVSLGDPWHLLISTFLLLFAIMNSFSVPSFFSDRKHLLCPLFFRTVKHPDIWERHPQMERWDNSSWAGFPPQPLRILLSHPGMYFSLGFCLPEGQELSKSPRESRAELLQGCVWHCRDGWTWAKDRLWPPLLFAQSFSQSHQRLVALVVTLFPCVALRRETWSFNNERTSRGRAKEVLGIEEGGS